MSDATPTPIRVSRQEAKSKGLTRYFTGKQCKNGHFDQRLVSNGRCAQCLRDYKAENRDQVNNAQRLHRKANAERWKELSRKYYYQNLEDNREKARIRSRKKAAKKPPRLRKYQSDIAKELANRMRCRMWYALRGGKGGKSLDEVLGYTVEELKTHLEKQFTKGMTWENRSQWEIDHIVPIVEFNLNNHYDAEFKACWALSNLRPIWKAENRSKSYRRTHLV